MAWLTNAKHKMRIRIFFLNFQTIGILNCQFLFWTSVLIMDVCTSSRRRHRYLARPFLGDWRSATFTASFWATIISLKHPETFAHGTKTLRGEQKGWKCLVCAQVSRQSSPS